jgi:WD40 repeat protein
MKSTGLRTCAGASAVVAWLAAAAGVPVAHAVAGTATEEAAHLQIELGDHGGAVRRIAADVARKLVVTGSDDRTARSWTLDDAGSPQRVFRVPVGAGEAGRIYGVALHPTLPWVAIGGSPASPRGAARAIGAAGAADGGGYAIHLFDVTTGSPLRRIDTRGGDVKRLRWSADGSLLIAAYAGAHGIRAFDAEGALVFEDRFETAVYALATSPRGRLAAAALDGTLRFYDAAEGRIQRRANLVAPARHPVAAAFSPDGRALALAYFAPGKAPDVVDWESGTWRSLPAPARMRTENLMAVAWSPSSGRVFAAGSYGFAQRQVALVEYDANRRAVVRETVVARFSIADLDPLADGRIAYAATDGAWGVAGHAGSIHRPSSVPDLTGAANLRVAADGKRISWTLEGGSTRVSFDLARRELAFGRGEDLPAATLRRGLFDAPADWENQPGPSINGGRVALAADEVSRAVALFAQGLDAALGTSRALYRIGAGGRVVWRVPTPTEVRAVHVTRGDRVIVTAMLDGTVRLWRSEDGQELLALLALRDGRWVMWTRGGAFDAGVGADSLVGWVVNRPEATADFFPVARLRERFHRPGYIDRLLETQDHDAAGRLQHAAAADESAGSADSVAASTVPAPVAPRPAELPPALSSPLPAGVLAAGGRVEIPFAVRTETSPDRLRFEARVDGRPVALAAVTPPRDGDGRAAGSLVVQAPAHAASLQVLAQDPNGFSVPLSFMLTPVPDAPRTDARAPDDAATAQPAVAAAVAAPIAAIAPPSKSTLPPLAKAPVAAARPRLFLLAVGVSEYARAEYRLGLAAKDARDFAAALHGQQGRFYREVTARVLVNDQAGRAAVLDALRWLSTVPGRDDVAILFIAGHGLNASSGKYYFLPHDGREEDLARTAIAEDEIRDALRSIAGRAVLFVDTCFAGKAIGTLSNRNRELSRFVNDLASPENGVVVFAASSGRQLSEESDDWGNGAFTRALLQGLAGRADLLRSGRITYKGLDYFVSEEVRRLTDGRQTPVSLSPWGVPDFAIAAMQEAAVAR